MECKDGLHNCSQVCIELQGEFSCACYGGYELLGDGVSCKGSVMGVTCNYCCINLESLVVYNYKALILI